MPAPITVSILYDKSNPDQNDVLLWERILKQLSLTQKPRLVDRREPLVHSDIQIHLDVPVYAAIPWAHTNVLMHSQNGSEAYISYLHAFDAILFRDPESAGAFREKIASPLYTIPWLSADIKVLCDAILPLFHSVKDLVLTRRPSKGVFHCPPLLHAEDCPPITVITPTYNRKKLIDIAFHNLLATDYPHDKIEWIVIEDNEKTPHMAGEKVMNFQMQAPKIRVKYMPIEGRLTIGQKRNLAIEQAEHDIILFMDDDDHYPTTSFRRRVAWLTKGTKRGQTVHSITCCTTLALYDLKRGVSAVNVPPYELPLAQRISEATLTFYKTAWEERKFPDVSISEGEGWIEGREDQVLEMQPQQIIVAFSHGSNQTTRLIPADQPPSCFWGFPKEYLVFIHGLVGVTLEK